jgi:hypothetical protein
MIIKGKKTESFEIDDEQVKNITLEYLYTKILKVDYPINDGMTHNLGYEYIDGNIVRKYIDTYPTWKDGEWYVINNVHIYGKFMKIILREASTTDILTLKMIKIIEDMK